MFTVRKKDIRPLVALLIAGFFVCMPLVAMAATLVPDCSTTDASGRLVNECGWDDLIILAENLLNFMVYISVPIAAIAFAYAGWLYVSSRGNSGVLSKAKGIFINVGIGPIIVLVAWGVVDLISTLVTNRDAYVPVIDTLR